MAERIPQSVAYLVLFKAYLSSDHATEATGKTIAITISKNGGAFGNPAAGATNATEISSGWYKVALGTGDTDTLGPLAIRGAVSGIDDVAIALMVVSANNAGFAALPDWDFIAKIANSGVELIVASGATTTSIPTSSFKIANAQATNIVADQFKGGTIFFSWNTTTPGLRGCKRAITASAASSPSPDTPPTLTVDTLPATPVSGDTAQII